MYTNRDKLVLHEWEFCVWAGNPPKENKVLISKDAQPWISADHMTLWNTRREIQIQTKLDQPSRRNEQHQTSETRRQLLTSREKRSWKPQEKMATRRNRNRSNDLSHGGWWWFLNYTKKNKVAAACDLMVYQEFPVLWKIHPQKPNKNTGFTHFQIELNLWLGGYRPQIPVLSALNWVCWTPSRKKIQGTPLIRKLTYRATRY
jgi:hypothetical protein